MTLLSALKARRDEILASAERYGVVDVRVFGSVARGEEGPDSDIDLLINVTEDCSAFGFLDFQKDVEDLMHRRIDIVFERGLFAPIRSRILSDAEWL